MKGIISEIVCIYLGLIIYYIKVFSTIYSEQNVGTMKEINCQHVSHRPRAHFKVKSFENLKQNKTKIYDLLRCINYVCYRFSEILFVKGSAITI